MSDTRVAGKGQYGIAARLRHDELSGELRMIYANSSFEPMVRGMAEGRWYVLPNLTTDLWVKKLQLKEQQG